MQEERGKTQTCWLYSVQLGASASTGEQSSHNSALQSSNAEDLYCPCGFDSLTASPQSDTGVTQRKQYCSELGRLWLFSSLHDA